MLPGLSDHIDYSLNEEAPAGTAPALERARDPFNYLLERPTDTTESSIRTICACVIAATAAAGYADSRFAAWLRPPLFEHHQVAFLAPLLAGGSVGSWPVRERALARSSARDIDHHHAGAVSYSGDGRPRFDAFYLSALLPQYAPPPFSPTPARGSAADARALV